MMADDPRGPKDPEEPPIMDSGQFEDITRLSEPDEPERRGQSGYHRAPSIEWLKDGSIEKWFDGTSIIKPPDREFLFEDLLLKETVGILAGEGGVGKGRVQLLAMVSGTTGRWIGPFKPIDPGPWFFIGKEDDRTEQHRRLYVTLQSLDRPLSTVETRRLIENLLVPPPIPSMTFGNELVDVLGEFCLGKDVSGIQIDPLARMWNSDAPGEINSQEGAAWALDWLGQIQQVTGASVLVTHHVNKEAKKASAKGLPMANTDLTGSGQLVDLARWVMQLGPVTAAKAEQMKMKGRNLIEAAVTKSNYTRKRHLGYFELTEAGAIVVVSPPEVLTRNAELAKEIVAEEGPSGIGRPALEKALREERQLGKSDARDAIKFLTDSDEAFYQGTRNGRNGRRIYLTQYSDVSGDTGTSNTADKQGNLIHFPAHPENDDK